mmetsp:Transcript_14811/g.32671  ORF Transcript_14811/g.32671 Transcript_14811/m.32671 type:complete len:201 (-) Transcript_14811:166-768(-)
MTCTTKAKSCTWAIWSRRGPYPHNRLASGARVVVVIVVFSSVPPSSPSSPSTGSTTVSFSSVGTIVVVTSGCWTLVTVKDWGSPTSTSRFSSVKYAAWMAGLAFLAPRTSRNGAINEVLIACFRTTTSLLGRHTGTSIYTPSSHLNTPVGVYSSLTQLTPLEAGGQVALLARSEQAVLSPPLSISGTGPQAMGTHWPGSL